MRSSEAAGSQPEPRLRLDRSYSLQRIFGATIFFGTDTQRERAAVIHRARFNFMSEARIWYTRDSAQDTLPGELQNEIVLSEEFFREIMDHPIPTDIEAARALSCSPAALDLVRALWPECPATINEDGSGLWVDRANAVLTQEVSNVRRF